MRMPESPHKVSLDRALAGEASSREDAVIGLNCRAGVARFTSEGDCNLFCQPCKGFNEQCSKEMPSLCLVCVRSASKIAPGGH
jgi:hypothetical protein